MKTEKVAIIGAGPAGISTAIQLKRYGINPVLFEKGEVGGLLKNANLVENYPGFPEGISGLNLIELFKKQLKNLSLKIFYEEIKRLDYANNIFLLKTPEKLFYSSIVVIASGTKPKRPTHFEISENAKNKIFYEVYPLLKVKKKQIIIIGAGDAAFDYALNLAKNNKITNKFFEKLLQIKKRLYKNGHFQLQFSIHTTDENLRNWLIPVKKWDFAKIADYGKEFYGDNDRKITLNFALIKGIPLEPDVLSKYFDPETFLIKITPLNPTYQVLKNKLSSYIDPYQNDGKYEVI